ARELLGGLARGFIKETREAFEDFARNALADRLRGLKDTYLRLWIRDIDEGLQDWGQVGLAITKGLFDPQARRDLQNEEGEKRDPDERSDVREATENGVGLVDTVLHALDRPEAGRFLTRHLIPMLGFP